MSNQNTKAILKHQKSQARIARQFKRGEISKGSHDQAQGILKGYIDFLQDLEDRRNKVGQPTGDETKNPVSFGNYGSLE